jgi:glycosyltransferase involved in cell wall biosynthesis
VRQPSVLHLTHADFRVPAAIVAIPACNEAADIERCLAALAMQRDETGAPVPAGAFEILIFANNCTDATADVAHAFAALVPHPVTVVAEQLPPDQRSAGGARKRAMDLAASKLNERGDAGLILTTDADSKTRIDDSHAVRLLSQIKCRFREHGSALLEKLKIGWRQNGIYCGSDDANVCFEVRHGIIVPLSEQI